MSLAHARGFTWPPDTAGPHLVHAEVDGEIMEDWEIAAFFSLLGSAANDHLMHGMHAMPVRWTP